MSSLIIGLTGERYAGKDEIAEYLIKKHGASHIKYSNVLDETLESLNLPITRRHEIDLGMALRQAFGEDILWGGMLKRIKEAWSGIVVINGIRFKNEFDNVKGLGGKIIYVTAPEKILFERTKSRTEKAEDGLLSLEDFKKQGKELTEFGIPALGASADFRIDNTDSLDQLYIQVEKILKTLNWRT